MSAETKLSREEVNKNYEEAKKSLIEARRKFTEAAKARANRSKRKKDTIRKNNEMDDASLAEKSRTWHALFLDKLAPFTAFDAALDNSYATTWLQKIDAFEAHPTDETMVDDLGDKTQTLEEKIAALLKLIDDLEYYAMRAFPGDERKLEEFGFEVLRKITPNHTGHLALMSYTTLLVAADYNSQLTAAGMPANLPTDINNAKDDASEAEAKQEYAKRLRIRATSQRVKMFNDLWDIHILIHKAAKIIFRDTAVVARQFE